MVRAEDEVITLQEMRFHCAAGHRWSETWPMPMDMAAFTLRARAAEKCPRCCATVYLGWDETPTAIDESAPHEAPT